MSENLKCGIPTANNYLKFVSMVSLIPLPYDTSYKSISHKSVFELFYIKFLPIYIYFIISNQYFITF